MKKQHVAVFGSNTGFSNLAYVINYWLEKNPDWEIQFTDYCDNNNYCSALVVFKRTTFRSRKVKINE